jgi:hypothetical protein
MLGRIESLEIFCEARDRMTIMDATPAPNWVWSEWS